MCVKTIKNMLGAGLVAAGATPPSAQDLRDLRDMDDLDGKIRAWRNRRKMTWNKIEAL